MTLRQDAADRRQDAADDAMTAMQDQVGNWGQTDFRDFSKLLNTLHNTVAVMEAKQEIQGEGIREIKEMTKEIVGLTRRTVDDVAALGTRVAILETKDVVRVETEAIPKGKWARIGAIIAYVVSGAWTVWFLGHGNK